MPFNLIKYGFLSYKKFFEKFLSNKIAKIFLTMVFCNRRLTLNKNESKTMNEINNNFSPKVQNVSSNNLKGHENINNNLISENQINEIQDNGILGKSQVAKADSINSDIDFCKKASPDFLLKCDMFFESALNTLIANGEENAYEKACVLAKEFSNEFV